MTRAEGIAVCVGYGLLSVIFTDYADNAVGWIDWLLPAIVSWVCAFISMCYFVRLITGGK